LKTASDLLVWIEQEPILVLYFENDAKQAAVVEFLFLIEIPNCETLLLRMACELLKFALTLRDSHVFVYSML
jgi:hypothetical protein